jgi:hypothetical protein
VKHSIKFVKSGRGQAQCPPNPDYPQGIEVDASQGAPSCAIDLPYPAPECGYFVVRCTLCGTSVAITAAGRPDDPIRVKLPCRLPKGAMA